MQDDDAELRPRWYAATQQRYARASKSSALTVMPIRC